MSRGPAGPDLRMAARLGGLPSAWLLGAGTAFAAALALAGCPKNGKDIDPAVASTVTQIGFIHNQIELFAVENRRAPTPSEGLTHLFDGVAPKDAWGNPIRYVVPGPAGRAYDLVSYGSDGREGGKGSAADLVWSELDE